AAARDQGIARRKTANRETDRRATSDSASQCRGAGQPPGKTWPGAPRPFAQRPSRRAFVDDESWGKAGGGDRSIQLSTTRAGSPGAPEILGKDPEARPKDDEQWIRAAAGSGYAHQPRYLAAGLGPQLPRVRPIS